MQPTLESERLLLRPFHAGDASLVQRLAGDRRIADTTMTIPHPYADGVASAWIARHNPAFSDGSGMTCAVVLREADVLIGAISLMDVSAAHARAELGYWIGADFWGQGYCTEAVQRLMPFARMHFGITKFVARCFARNPASARVIEKAGFSPEGRLASHIRKNGRFEDVLLFGLVLSEHRR